MPGSTPTTSRVDTTATRRARASETARDSWVDFAAGVVQQPFSVFPTVDLLSLLYETFEAIVEWNTLREDGAQQWLYLHPPPSWPPPGTTEYVLEHLQEHPLVRWYGTAGSIRPMTLGRVPTEVAEPRLVARAREVMSSPDLHQQLAVPLRMRGRSHSVLVLSRGGADFTEAQVQLAEQLQPLLMVLERTAQYSSRLGESTANYFGLTHRESAVLDLLCAGMTVNAIARRLCCTPRTVEKHLEHVYRKMDVRDRLSAIRAAEAHRRTGAELDRSPSDLLLTPPQSAAFAQRADLLVMSGCVPRSHPAPG
jgi:DNA-binding CsgD family transcriptional regulator